jgi:uncharacterized protein (TIGR02996 family)
MASARAKKAAAPAKKKPAPRTAAPPARIKKAGNAPNVKPPPGVTDPREKEILESIWAAPDDDRPRLVYSDWLQEKGDPRGEYIELSCKDWGSTPWDDPVRRKADARASALEKKYRAQWVASARPYIRSWGFARGFVASIVADAGTFLENPGAVVALSPSISLQLTAVKPKQMPAIAAAPLGKLERLDLGSQRIDDAQLAILAASPTLLGLRELHLGWNNFLTAGAQALAASPHIRTLKTLRVDGYRSAHSTYGGRPAPPPFDDALIAIVTSPNLPALEYLDLGNGGAGPGLGEAFLRASLPALHTLAMSGNPIGDAGAIALARAKLPSLRYLGLGYGNLTDAGVNALLDGFPQLESLDVGEATPFGEAVQKRLKERFPHRR